MNPSFEQASAFLDQAILFYSGGEIEQAAQCMAEAAAMLHQIQLPPAAAKLEPEAFQPVTTDTAAEMAPEILLSAPSPPHERPLLQPVEIESASTPSPAIAA